MRLVKPAVVIWAWKWSEESTAKQGLTLKAGISHFLVAAGKGESVLGPGTDDQNRFRVDCLDLATESESSSASVIHMIQGWYGVASLRYAYKADECGCRAPRRDLAAEPDSSIASYDEVWLAMASRVAAVRAISECFKWGGIN